MQLIRTENNENNGKIYIFQENLKQTIIDYAEDLYFPNCGINETISVDEQTVRKYEDRVRTCFNKEIYSPYSGVQYIKPRYGSEFSEIRKTDEDYVVEVRVNAELPEDTRTGLRLKEKGDFILSQAIASDRIKVLKVNAGLLIDDWKY